VAKRKLLDLSAKRLLSSFFSISSLVFPDLRNLSEAAGREVIYDSFDDESFASTVFGF
jgi:hypothetical protein